MAYYSGFQSNAFQRNAYQIRSGGAAVSPSNPYPMHHRKPVNPWLEYKNAELKRERERLHAVEAQLAQAEIQRQAADKLLAEKTARQREKRAALLLVKRERQLLEEINALRMERAQLIRLIDDEEAILVLMLARPLIH